MSNPVIRAALEGRLNTWALAQVPPVQLAWQSVSFEKEAGKPFLEPILIPNLTVNHEVSGSRKTHLGLFQINVWAPTGEGMGRVEAMAQAIVDLFPLVPKFGNVSIEATPTASNPLPGDAGWVIVPILIKYRYEAA